MADSFSALLRHHLSGRVIVDEEQVAALERHYELLTRWNRRLNLTSIREMEEGVIRHYCECLFFASLLPRGARVLDLGSGAGFPGFPIAVLNSDSFVSLLESHQRKAVFLREAVRAMSNVEVLGMRASEVAGSWDLLVSRAVTPADVLRQVPRLAARTGILVGEDFLQKRAQFPLIQWEEPVKVPWGENRWAVFGMFHVER